MHVFRPAHSVPATIEKEDSTPGTETRRHQRIVAAKQIAPAEIGPFEQIDLAHDEIGQHAEFLWLPLPDVAAQWALHAGQRYDCAAVGTILGRRIAVVQVAVEIDLLLQ